MTPRHVPRAPNEARYLGRLHLLISLRGTRDFGTALSGIAALAKEASADLGPDHPVTLEIEVRHQQALATDDQSPATSALALGALHDRCEEALPLLHPVVRSVRATWAQYIRKSGDVDQGVELYRRELDLRLRAYGSDAYATCLARLNLAVALRDRGRPDDLTESAGLGEEEIAIRLRAFGEDHAFTWVAQASLLTLRLDHAEQLVPDEGDWVARDLVTGASDTRLRRQGRFGRHHELTLRSARSEARVMILIGRVEQAVWTLWSVQSGEVMRGGGGHRGTTSYHLARALARTGDPADRELAERQAHSAHEQLLRHRGAQHRYTTMAAKLAEDLARSRSRHPNSDAS